MGNTIIGNPERSRSVLGRERVQDSGNLAFDVDFVLGSIVAKDERSDVGYRIRVIQRAGMVGGRILCLVYDNTCRYPIVVEVKEALAIFSFVLRNGNMQDIPVGIDVIPITRQPVRFGFTSGFPKQRKLN